MAVRTDLAAESLPAGGNAPQGITRTVRRGKCCEITEIRVETPEAGREIGKPPGSYITVDVGKISFVGEDEDEAAKEIAEELKKLLPQKGTVLVVGLGNDDITPDAIGPLTAEKLLVTRHLEDELPSEHPLRELRGVAALAPGVLGQTGIEAAEIVGAVCKRISPEAVVVVDALACRDVSRLGTTIQIADSGISPGSGVQNKRKELSKATLGVPVIAVGTPTVVDLHTIAENLTGSLPSKELPNMMVTPRDVDLLAQRGAELMAMALNLALQPELSPEDIRVLR